MPIQTDTTVVSIEHIVLSLQQPAYALQLPFALLTMAMTKDLQDCELHDKFIVEIVILLNWYSVECRSSRMLRSKVAEWNAVSVKEEELDEDELATLLQKPTCPLTLPIAQIMIAVDKQPALRHRLIAEVAHVLHAVANAHTAAIDLAYKSVEEHLVWLQQMKVAQGPLPLDRRAARHYLEYHDMMLLERPEAILLGMDNFVYTSFQIASPTLSVDYNTMNDTQDRDSIHSWTTKTLHPVPLCLFGRIHQCLSNVRKTNTSGF
jgi:hypothetical protein